MDFAKLLEVFVVVLFTSSGQLLLRTGMRDFKLLDEGIGKLITFILQTPLLWLAIALYGISTLLWMRVLSKYPVGSVYPMVAIGYVLVTIGGVVFLGERVPLQGWIALAIICFGTLLLAATPASNPA
jgi:drug/metabolite transporter (DMT)-like permease